MKAVVYREYGPPEVLQVVEMDKPVPKDNEILIRVRVTTVCAGDVRFRKADPFIIRFINGLSRPKKWTVLGLEFAGTIESIGRNVTRFAAGDDVFGASEFRFATYAEYLCLAEVHKYLAKKPTDVGYQEAAAIPFGGISSLHFLRKANIRPGQKVLVYGASGSLGTYAVQLAKHLGAYVTGVCSTANVDLVRSLGADEVIDYTKEDFSQRGQTFDVVFETVGKARFRQVSRAVKRGGVMLHAVPSFASFLGGMWASMTGRAKSIGGIAKGDSGDLEFLAGLVAVGKMRTVIERCYRLDDIAEAHRHVDTGRKRGNVTVAIP